MRWLVLVLALLWSIAALLLVAARWIDPPSTAVHIQRRVQAWIHHTPYRERYKFVPLSQISPDLQHAVVAAEDARFYQHHGFDWHEVQIAAEGDLGLLRIVLENFIGNAWKFTAHTAAPTIEFGADSTGASTVFFVRDNGAGFDMTYAEKLFAPFQRLHSEAEFPGTGIGLATVQRIIERHGGSV